MRLEREEEASAISWLGGEGEKKKKGSSDPVHSAFKHRTRERERRSGHQKKKRRERKKKRYILWMAPLGRRAGGGGKKKKKSHPRNCLILLHGYGREEDKITKKEKGRFRESLYFHRRKERSARVSYSARRRECREKKGEEKSPFSCTLLGRERRRIGAGGEEQGSLEGGEKGPYDLSFAMKRGKGAF